MISYNELTKILDKLGMDKNLTSIEFRENGPEIDHTKELTLLDRTCRAVIAFSYSTSNQYQKETRMIYYRRKDAPRGYILDLEEFLKDD